MFKLNDFFNRILNKTLECTLQTNIQLQCHYDAQLMVIAYFTPKLNIVLTAVVFRQLFTYISVI